MARSAEQDRRIYAHILDGSIVVGVITIVLHIVLSAGDTHSSAMLYTGLVITSLGAVVGLYFLKRRKDAP